MRIAFLAVRLADDGGSRVIVDWANWLSGKGHRVSIVLPRGSYNCHFTINAEIREVGLAVHGRMLSLFLNFVPMLFLAPSADVYVGGMPPVPVLVYLLSSLRGASGWNFLQHDDVPFFDDRSHLRSAWLVKIYRAVAQMCLRLPLNIVANSSWTASRYRDRTGRFCGVVTPGIDINVFHPREDSVLGPAPHEIVCVGSKARWKGLPEIMEALHLLWQRGLRFRLTIVSKDDLRFGVVPFEFRIVRPGSDDDLRHFYSAANVFVHAAWTEGFALPPLEAMACGVPVVITDCGGPGEYAANEFNCVMVPPKDSRALADAIQRLLENPLLSRNLARNGVKTAMRFSTSETYARLEELLFGTSREASVDSKVKEHAK